VTKPKKKPKRKARPKRAVVLPGVVVVPTAKLAEVAPPEKLAEIIPARDEAIVLLIPEAVIPEIHDDFWISEMLKKCARVIKAWHENMLAENERDLP
jgi:hypothetical protein